jgi:hypothetical protein
MIYYFRQPNPKVESYEVYQNTSLTKVGELLLDTVEKYELAIWSVKFLNSLNK